MKPNYFRALLLTETGDLLERGYGTISVEEGTVDFVNDFVPLLLFGTAVRIACLADNEVAFVMEGKVYISIKTRLRIIIPDPSNLANAEKLLLQNIQMDLTLSPIPRSASLFSSLSRVKQEKQECYAYFISRSRVHISSHLAAGFKLKVGEQYAMQSRQPIQFDRVTITVDEVLRAGKLPPRYVCSLEDMTEEERQELGDYLDNVDFFNLRHSRITDI